MSLRTLVSSSPGLTRLLLSHAPPSLFERRGPAFARRVLDIAIGRTAAYPAFLAEHGIDPSDVTWERFTDLPVTTKREYLDRYPLRDRVVDGDLHRSYVIERSSGTGGGCYYWPRLPEQDADALAHIDMGMRMYYHIDTVPTLLLSTLALGTWVGGVKFAEVLRRLAASGKYPVTVVTPGTNLEETLQLVRDLSPEYEQTLLFGYPPFLKTVLDEGAARGIAWPRYHVRLGTGGEGFPEEWREHVMARLGLDPERDLLAIMGGYGAADLGGGNGVGNENAFTVLVRRLCLHDAPLCRDLFGEETLPNLYQYDPGSAYIEEMAEQLVLTVSAAIPLVRYAIHDLGGTIPFETVAAALRDHGLDAAALMKEHGRSVADIWPMPFLYCYGRADGTVSVGGANVYPENVAAILAGADDTDILGHKLGIVNERFVILLEHRDPMLTKADSRALAKRYHPLIVEGLQRVNSEYRDQYAGNRRVADPLIEVFAAGSGPFKDDVGRLKRRYTVQGHPAAA
ncbi:MAG TPA: phenylacetate--CoA ligase family protein [Coriobacteriia bacterium]|jgi:phenylacetate-CoA ligase